MPIYEYKCQSCGHELEKLQRIGEPDLTDCPFCNECAGIWFSPQGRGLVRD